jgi:prepilin-type N-terminal cleavage/methylation domain-containing protein
MRRTHRRRRGFNLLEVVVAIAIITMLSSAVGVYAIARYRDSRVDVARAELETLEGQLDAYGTPHLPIAVHRRGAQGTRNDWQNRLARPLPFRDS